MMNTRSFASFLLLATSLAACGSEDPPADVTILERADAAPGPSDAAPEPDPEPTGPIAAEYDQISGTTGLYADEMDANGNDAVMVWGDLSTEDPTATIYLELYEGWGHFLDGEGAPVAFGQLALPDSIEIGENERDYANCGACLSIFVGLPADWSTYDKQLVAQEGTIELVAMPTAPDEAMSVVLHDVTFKEVDDWGVLVDGGETAHITTMVLATTPAAE